MNAIGTAVKVVHINIPRNCETCLLWNKTGQPEGFGACTWQPKEMFPPWAEIDRGSDHADITRNDDGYDCATYRLNSKILAE